MAKTLARGSRITGSERGTLTSQFTERYAAGESIRSLAAAAGRSYGFVHNLLTEGGASLRQRGGATRGAKATSSDKRGRSTVQAPAKKTPAKKGAAKKAPVRKAVAK